MPKVRGGGQKWKARTSASQADYMAGVQNPRVAWDQATAKAVDNYNTGIQQSIAENRFTKGVAAAGHSGWQGPTLKKGPQRFVQGVTQSEDAYDRGFAPYKAAIESTTLPDRGPANSEVNYQRQRDMATALHNKKRQIKSGS